MTEAWTKWGGLVSEQSQSGESVAAFCRERGLRTWHFCEWFDPPGKKGAFYADRARYRGTDVAWKQVERFVPEQEIRW
jgi:hypothetical protein